MISRLTVFLVACAAIAVVHGDRDFNDHRNEHLDPARFDHHDDFGRDRRPEDVRRDEEHRGQGRFARQAHFDREFEGHRDEHQDPARFDHQPDRHDEFGRDRRPEDVRRDEEHRGQGRFARQAHFDREFEGHRDEHQDPRFDHQPDRQDDFGRDRRPDGRHF